MGGLTLAPLARHVSSASLEPVTLTTATGRVRGLTVDGIHVFKGVRYGADTSARRFRPPVAPVPWTGVRDALEFGPIAPQPSTGGRAIGEDCLHLNVWTPALGDNARRPVMVWFHPGAFSSGTSNELEADGARLSRRGNVVVVTVNHRLNVLGHLYLAEHGGEEFADSGNVGLLDLVLALQWVRDHAGALGGDPGNVTVFGQSGGGAKIATLMAMPVARGLFHRAITMSGQQITGEPGDHRGAACRSVPRGAADPKGTRPRSGDAAARATGQGEPCPRVHGAREGRTIAPARSVRSRCAAAVSRHPDDPGQHARGDANAHRARRRVDLRADLGLAAAEARGELAVHGQPRSWSR